MKSTCFRNGGPGSGKFRWWTSFQQLMRHNDIKNRLVQEIDRIFYEEEHPYGSWDFTIEHPSTWIGWTSTVPEDELPEHVAIERFHPNKRSSAYKVANTDFRAPRTRLISFVVEVKTRGRKNVVLIHSIYPGEVVELRGDIEPEEAVFIPFEYKGA